MRKTTLIALLIFSKTIFSQEKDSLKNRIILSGNFESSGQWYTNDVRRGISHDSVPLRSNNYLALNASFNKFSGGIQIESYENEALLNFNPKYSKTNIGTYFLNYKNDKLDVTAGYFYEQFGNGLALRSGEDRSLGINNSIRGGRIVYKPLDQISLTVLYGNQRTGFDVSKGKIFGFNTEVDFIKLLFPNAKYRISYAGSFVNRNEDLPEDVKGVNHNTYIISNRMSFNKDRFYVNLEYDYKSKDAVLNNSNLDYNFVKPGNAILINLGYAEKGFGIDASLRRIENMLFLSERKPEIYGNGNSLNYNDKFLNYIPSLTKQHHSALANIYVYQSQNITSMQFDEKIEKFGEIGGQIDLFYHLKKGSFLGGKYGTKISLNWSELYNLDADYSYFNSNAEYAPNYSAKFLGTNQKYFSEKSIEISKKITPAFSGLVSVIHQFYNDQYIRGIFQDSKINSTILFAEGTLIFPNTKSLKISAEHLWTSSDRKNWVGGSLEYAHNENFSIFASDIYNYGFEEDNHLINPTDLFDIHFYNFGATYRKNNFRLSLNYGRQRGGLVCVGGICRFVPPSTGLGMQLNYAL